MTQTVAHERQKKNKILSSLRASSLVGGALVVHRRSVLVFPLGALDW